MKHRPRFKVVLVLLAVLLVVTFLLWGILPAFVSFPIRGNALLQTRTTLSVLKGGIIAYCEEHKELPGSMKDLERFLPGLPYHDAWENRIRYVHEDPIINESFFDLYSVGRNGRDEYRKKMHGDDIVLELSELYREMLREALAADQGLGVTP